MNARRVSIALVISVFTACSKRCDMDHSMLASLDCGHDHTIDISTDTHWEWKGMLYYRVEDDGREVLPWTLLEPSYQNDGFRYDITTLKYKCVATRDGAVAGVTTDELPYAVLALRDFEHRVSWPGNASEAEAVALRRRLQVDHPQLDVSRKLADRDYLEQASWLELSDSDIGDEDLARLSDRSFLSGLELSRTRVTDRGLEYLVRLPDLRVLRLRGTAVSDAAVPLLSRMPLMTLDVRDTRITAAGVKALREALPKAYIDSDAH
jgi:hypothetical protein